MVCCDPPPPPTPAISDALVTSPSIAPKTAGRSQPPATSRCPWPCDSPSVSSGFSLAVVIAQCPGSPCRPPVADSGADRAVRGTTPQRAASGHYSPCRRQSPDPARGPPSAIRGLGLLVLPGNGSRPGRRGDPLDVLAERPVGQDRLGQAGQPAQHAAADPRRRGGRERGGLGRPG